MPFMGELSALTFTFSKPEQKANFPELQVKRIKFYTDDSEMDMDGIESVLKNNKVAFILTEIIQGEGGMNVANKKFISCLRRYADEYGIPLIVDEVQSGVGRTGKWWSYEHYEIKPDITISAKALQVGATIYKKTLDPMEKGVLSSTWGGGDRIDLALGAKIIDIIRREKLLNNAYIMGEKIKRACHELVGKNGIIDIRGIGLMIGIEFDDKNRKETS
jgi:4-aminobutyrate aminotransferase